MLTTHMIREGIQVTDKAGNPVCLIRRTADGTYVLEAEGPPAEICPAILNMEFLSMKSAEYAALIIHLELMASGH
jgi:hypothetical protein